MPYTSHSLVENLLRTHWDLEDVARRRPFFVGFDTDASLSQPPVPAASGWRSSLRRLAATTRALVTMVFEPASRG